MPISSLTFAHSRAYHANSQRPYAEVFFEDPATGKKSPKILCLVDTGADYTILPLSVATSIGLAPSGPIVSVGTPVGGTFTLKSHSVPLTIEGYRINGSRQVLFSAVPKFNPIVGLSDLMTAFDIGFDTANWHWG